MRPRLLAVITDETRAPEWAEDLVESRKIQTLSPWEWIEYNHFGTPFIIRDRDVVNRVKVEIDARTRSARVIQNSVETPLLPLTRHVRADLIRAEFRVSAISPKQTHFDGEILIDPKGSMPKWISNLFQRSWPRSTLERLRAQAAKADIRVPEHYLRALSGEPQKHTGRPERRPGSL